MATALKVGARDTRSHQWADEAARASDGRLLWRNDTGGESTESRMSPQGYLLATSTNLFVPQGRVSPAAFDRQDGRRLYEVTAPAAAVPGNKNPAFVATYGNRAIGGSFALLADNQLYTGTEEIIGYDSATRVEAAWFAARKVIMTESVVYLSTSNAVLALKREIYPNISVTRFHLRTQRVQLNASSGESRKEKKRLTELIAHERATLADFDAKLTALSPGDPAHSPLYQRITSTDTARRMPLACPFGTAFRRLREGRMGLSAFFGNMLTGWYAWTKSNGNPISSR